MLSNQTKLKTLKGPFFNFYKTWKLKNKNKLKQF